MPVPILLVPAFLNFFLPPSNHQLGFTSISVPRLNIFLLLRLFSVHAGPKLLKPCGLPAHHACCRLYHLIHCCRRNFQPTASDRDGYIQAIDLILPIVSKSLPLQELGAACSFRSSTQAEETTEEHLATSPAENLGLSSVRVDAKGQVAQGHEELSTRTMQIHGQAKIPRVPRWETAPEAPPFPYGVVRKNCGERKP